MRHLSAALALTTLLASGCIIYSEDGHVDSHADCWSCDPGEEDADSGDVEPDPEFTLSISPDTIEVGATELLHIRADGDFDMLSVTDVHFGGPVDVLSVIVQDDETLVVVEVSALAEPGEVDVFVERAQAETITLDTPLLLIEATDAGDTGTDGTGC
jgi:hypothetical protein